MSKKGDEYVTFSVRLPKRKVAQLDKLRILSGESSRNNILGLSIEILDRVAQTFSDKQVENFADTRYAEVVARIRQGYIEMLDSMKKAEEARKK